MKTTLHLLTFILAIAFTAGCKKSNNPNLAKPGTKFTFNGTAYTSAKFVYRTSEQYELLQDSAVADDKSKILIVNFVFSHTGAKPTAGDYQLISAGNNAVNTGQVLILIAESKLNDTDHISSYYSYTNTAAGTIKITSSSGKVSLTAPTSELYGTTLVSDGETTIVTKPTLQGATYNEN